MIYEAERSPDRMERSFPIGPKPIPVGHATRCRLTQQDRILANDPRGFQARGVMVRGDRQVRAWHAHLPKSPDCHAEVSRSTF